jgi:hypothetical protein
VLININSFLRWKSFSSGVKCNFPYRCGKRQYISVRELRNNYVVDLLPNRYQDVFAMFVRSCCNKSGSSWYHLILCCKININGFLRWKSFSSKCNFPYRCGKRQYISVSELRRNHYIQQVGRNSTKKRVQTICQIIIQVSKGLQSICESPMQCNS